MQQSELGKRIERRRRELGISQVELAESAGVSQSLITHLETGRTEKVDCFRIFALAAALKTTADWLVFGKSVEGA